MATGDQADLLARIKRQLPRWFGDETPVLDALLSGPAWAFSFLYGLYAYVRLQVRISTATGGWLDLIAWDFFGSALLRYPGQSDASLRAIILNTLLRERGTRAALAKVLLDVTGRAPRLIEPFRTDDTAVWDMPGYYSSGYAYGTRTSPFTIFAEAYRPLAGTEWAGISDAAIFAAANSVRPVGYKVYLRLRDNPP